MAADCKSAALCATEVRILPCAPLNLSCELVEFVIGECSGSKPGRQRQDVDCAGRPGVVGASSLADDGARQVSTADLDTVRIFCLPRHTRMDAFAIGL